MLRDYLELIRVPNVFTAMADVVMGFFFVTQAADVNAGSAVILGLLLTASILFYSAGMILNDVFDYDEDLRDRPDRPLPSGRISRKAAGRVGFSLLAAGCAIAFLATHLTGEWSAVLCGGVLSALIVHYDALGKKDAIVGPLELGLCRTANVLLGMSAATAGQPGQFQTACLIGLYIVGVSVMARPEAGPEDSPDAASGAPPPPPRPIRSQILLGVILMIAAVSLLVWLPSWRPIQLDNSQWRGFVLLLAALVAWRCFRALLHPSPATIQQAVAQSITSLIVVDAGITLAVAGVVPGLAVLALLIPNLLLRRLFYTT